MDKKGTNDSVKRRLREKKAEKPIIPDG